MKVPRSLWLRFHPEWRSSWVPSRQTWPNSSNRSYKWAWFSLYVAYQPD